MKAQEKKQDLITLAARFIRENHPDAVAVAFMELNCQCIKMCGVAADGCLLGPLTLVLGAAAVSKNRLPSCRSCGEDSGISLQRLVRHGLIWNEVAAGQPGEDWRMRLGRRIFGDRYDETAPFSGG